MSQPLKPFLKWAGGKRWLFESGQYSLPNFSGRYFEPFLGGGAVYFEIRPKEAVLSDSNNKLVELYEAIRDNPKIIEDLIKKHSSQHSVEYYYKMRDREFSCKFDRSAQFLYLNRTCWNGLYRENLKGKFNVPIGSKETVVFQSDDFGIWSDALKGARIECRDFEDSIDETNQGDFVFVDPPYTVRHNVNGFVKYNQSIFSWEDQVRLRDALVKAKERGVSFAMTNADHESVKELYSGVGAHRTLNRHSVIAGSSKHRAQSTELLVTS